MKTDKNILETLFLGKKHKQVLSIFYTCLLFIFMFYYAGKVIGEALYFATH